MDCLNNSGRKMLVPGAFYTVCSIVERMQIRLGVFSSLVSANEAILEDHKLNYVDQNINNVDVRYEINLHELNVNDSGTLVELWVKTKEELVRTYDLNKNLTRYSSLLTLRKEINV